MKNTQSSAAGSTWTATYQLSWLSSSRSHALLVRGGRVGVWGLARTSLK